MSVPKLFFFLLAASQTLEHIGSKEGMMVKIRIEKKVARKRRRGEKKRKL